MGMIFSVHHCLLGTSHWYLLDRHKDEQEARRRARNYALDHGGYVCVKDADGKVIYGTDPVELARVRAA
jgi:ligand-binding sensor domain-containing protein